MEKILKNIDHYKHIVIVLPKDSSLNHLASANAVYTYLLQQHKKVSLYCEDNKFDVNLYFLPWIDKIKTSYPSSADFSFNAVDSSEVFYFFQKNNIRLNQKMSTSLYAGLLDETKGFRVGINAKIFAMAQELVNSGADVEKCTKNVLNFQTLAALRFKAILLKKMVLKENATIALFDISDVDLKASGARLQEFNIIIDEALSLPSVEKVIIKYNGKIIEKKDQV